MQYKDLAINPVSVVLQLVGAKWKILIIKELLKKGNYYFVSGMVAILYPDDESEVFEIYKLVTKYLQHKLGIHIVHILSENFFLSVIGKSIADVIEGRVVLANDICAEMR